MVLLFEDYTMFICCKGRDLGRDGGIVILQKGIIMMRKGLYWLKFIPFDRKENFRFFILVHNCTLFDGKE